MTDCDKLLTAAWLKKRWHNNSEFCNRKTHPIVFRYRRYSRGKNRCTICGAKIGKVQCVYKSRKDLLVDDIFETSPLLALLKKRGSVSVQQQT